MAVSQDDGLDGIASEMAAVAAEVEGVLDNLLPIPQGPEARLFDAIRYAVLAPAKRLRPILVLASAELFGLERRSALQVAAAVEMVHSYSLVHDDLPCMDDDDIRRGQPSTHIKFDEATAVLVGDALIPMAFAAVADHATHEDPLVRVELTLELAKASGAHGMVGGQAIDITMQKVTSSIGEITRSQQMKTGALIAFACESGAILSRAVPQLRHALHAYAHDLGLAFQITDDLLDADGDAERRGKGSAVENATFVSLLGFDRARTQAEILTQQAIKHLEPFAENAEFLKRLARFVLKRDK